MHKSDFVVYIKFVASWLPEAYEIYYITLLSYFSKILYGMNRIFAQYFEDRPIFSESHIMITEIGRSFFRKIL